MDFCVKVRNKLPGHFYNKRVLDIGFFSKYGTNEKLFENCNYHKMDVGGDLNFISRDMSSRYDTIIATKCFEYDMFYEISIWHSLGLLSFGGLFLFTCEQRDPKETECAYCSIVTEVMIKSFIDVGKVFSEHLFESDNGNSFFYGIKKS